MDCRAAAWEDLPQLRRMYLAIVDEMQKNGLSIWDEVYPCVALEDDIHRRRLYCIPGGPDGIAAAFALSPAHNGERHVLWPWPDARAVYLDRLGVDPRCAHRGFGSAALHCACLLARRADAQVLRLFAAESNDPAVRLYQNSGFRQAMGIYEERIDAGFSLRELGFEKNL